MPIGGDRQANGIGNAVDIACTNSKYRYELIQVAQKFFNRNCI